MATDPTPQAADATATADPNLPGLRRWGRRWEAVRWVLIGLGAIQAACLVGIMARWGDAASLVTMFTWACVGQVISLQGYLLVATGQGALVAGIFTGWLGRRP